MSASTMPDRVTLRGQRDGEVGGDARLADAALARRDEQWSSLRAGLGERDRPPLGMAVCLALSGSGGRVAVEPLAQRLALVVGHHREVEVDAIDAVEGRDSIGHATLDLVAQRAPGDGEGDEDGGRAVATQLDVANHPEVDDRAV